MTKLCVCLGREWQNQWPVYLPQADLLELRLDLMFPDGSVTKEMCKNINNLLKEIGSKIILTCRPGAISQELRSEWFLALLPCAPAFIDIEYDTPADFKDSFRSAAGENGVRIIWSYHRFEDTPEYTELCDIASQGFAWGADWVKIVTRCRDGSDEARLLSLYREPHYAGRITAFSMGAFGLTSRLHATVLDAPVIYLAPDEGEPVVLGQPRFSQFKAHLLNLL